MRGPTPQAARRRRRRWRPRRPGIAAQRPVHFRAPAWCAHFSEAHPPRRSSGTATKASHRGGGIRQRRDRSWRRLCRCYCTRVLSLARRARALMTADDLFICSSTLHLNPKTLNPKPRKILFDPARRALKEGAHPIRRRRLRHSSRRDATHLPADPCEVSAPHPQRPIP